MIESFKHKGLAQYWYKNDARKLDARMMKRITVRLEALDAATAPEDMNIPGWNFHPLQGNKKTEPVVYSIHVNGPWCITFEFEEGDACRVDLDQYH